MLLLSRTRDFLSFFPSLAPSPSFPPTACCHPHLPLKAHLFFFFSLFPSLSPFLIISVLTLPFSYQHALLRLSYAFLLFSRSHTPPTIPPTPLPPLPLFFQLSGRGYLRLRIHKTRLRCVCFCYFPKMVQWLPHCLLLILIQLLPVKRRASCGLAVTRGLDGALPSVGFR